MFVFLRTALVGAICLWALLALLPQARAATTVINEISGTVYHSVRGDNLEVHGDVSGEIYAHATQGSSALAADSNLLVLGDISGKVKATGHFNVYSIWGKESVTLAGGVSGTVLGTGWLGEGWNYGATGIGSDGLIHIKNGITGSIKALTGRRDPVRMYGSYALNSRRSLIVEGGISGTVGVTGQCDVAALKGYGAMTLSGDISGTVSAAGAWKAEGISAGRALYINDGISGTIEVNSRTDVAYGIKAESLVLKGGIKGSITALSELNSYGITTSNNLSIAGGIEGQITARSDAASQSHGLRSSFGNITVSGEIAGTISASAGTGDAYGVIANKGSVTINNGISGTISAQAGGHSSYGLYAKKNLDILGGITGNIRAQAGAYNAAALCGDRVTVSSHISGTISATARDSAYALWGMNTLRINNGISGIINAIATQTNANGILTGQLHISEGISGTVSSQADAFAYGIRTSGSTTIQGEVAGTVSGTAGTDNAYGLYSDGGTISISGGITGKVESRSGGINSFGLNGKNGVSVTGGISGTITTVAGGHTAIGLTASHGHLNGGDPDTALDISGTVSARAQGLAVAVSSGSGMNIAVSGTLIGHDQTGGGAGYAIRSGRPNGSGGWVDTAAVDTITLGKGANLVGKVDLSGGNDTLTLEGAVTTDSLISGGSGTDTFGLSGTGTTAFRADISEFERLAKSGSGTWNLTGNMGTLDTTVGAGILEVQGTLASPTTIIDAGGELAISGTFDADTVSGAGAFTIRSGGRGNVAVSMDVTGPVTVLGNLVVPAFTSKVLDLDSGGVLAVVNALDITDGGRISGTLTTGTMTVGGPLIITSDGTVTVGSDASFNGGVVVNGVLISPTTILNRGGTLCGAGRIVGNLVNQGRIAPGNSPGTLTIQGNYVHGPDATLDMEITPTTNDRLIVTGTADLQGGTMALDLTPGYYHTGTHYQLISAASGITGFFDTVTDNSPFLDIRLNRENGILTGMVTRASYGRVATNQNARQAGTALTAAVNTSSAIDQKIVTVLDFLPAPVVSQGLDQLDPEPFDAVSQVALSTMQNFASATRDRAKPFGLYIKPLGQIETQDQSGNRTGYNAGTYGVAAGADMGILDKGVLGLQLGYAHSGLEFRDTANSRAESDHFLASLYGSYFNKGLYADAVIQAGASANTMERRILFGSFDHTAKSEFTSYNYSAGLKLGYDFKVGKRIKIGPLGSMDYASVSNPQFTESGAPGFNLEIMSNRAESLKSTLGLRASADFDLTGQLVLVPDLSVKWEHEFLNHSRAIGASFSTSADTGFFACTGDPSRDAMRIGAGLTLKIKKTSKVFARYTGELLAGDRKAHAVAAGFGYEF